MDGLTFNAGVFISEQETEELNLDIGSFATSNPNIFQRDTVEFDRQLNAIWTSGGVYGHQMQEALEQAAGITSFGPAEGEDPLWVFPALNDDLKLTEYFWERSLVKSQSTQARVRATYTFDTDWFFDTQANHTFLAGYHYINDDVDFPDGAVNRANAIANPAGDVSREEWTRQQSSDGMYYRSIHNYTPIFFDGRNDGVDGHSTVRAGDVYLNQDIVQEGFYGVYNGKFFDDRLQLIMGIRRDIYNADQFTYKRVDIADEELLLRADEWIDQQVSKEV